MATPPTLVNSYSPVWNTSPQTLTVMNAIAVNAGEVIVQLGGIATSDGGIRFSQSENGAASFVGEGEQHAVNTCEISAVSYIVPSNETLTTSVAHSGWGGESYGAIAVRFSDSDGVGASNVVVDTSGDNLISLTTEEDNSAVVVLLLDWQATDGSSRTWATVNSYTPTAGNGGEKVYAIDNGQYTIYAAVYPDVGAAGAKSFGLTAPDSTNISIVAVEIKGVTVPPPTFFGSARNPADTSAAVSPPVSITPVSNMVENDLCIVHVGARASSAFDFSNSTTGGQTWNKAGEFDSTNTAKQATFWCEFNGTWDANPAFTNNGSVAMWAEMQVFRPGTSTSSWAVDQAYAGANFSAPTTPFTVTRNGVTNTQANTVTVATWQSVDDNTWGTLSGAGWATYSPLYTRVGTNASHAHAYYIGGSGGTGNVSLREATLGGDAGSTSIVSFYEVPAAEGPYEESLTFSATLSQSQTPAATAAASRSEGVTLGYTPTPAAQAFATMSAGITLGQLQEGYKVISEAVVFNATLTYNVNAAASAVALLTLPVVLAQQHAAIAQALPAATFPITLNAAQVATIATGGSVTFGVTLGITADEFVAPVTLESVEFGVTPGFQAEANVVTNLALSFPVVATFTPIANATAIRSVSFSVTLTHALTFKRYSSGAVAFNVTAGHVISPKATAKPSLALPVAVGFLPVGGQRIVDQVSFGVALGVSVSYQWMPESGEQVAWVQQPGVDNVWTSASPVGQSWQEGTPTGGAWTKQPPTTKEWN